ncbi:MAG: phosphocholine cytidylyltransferase family protein [Candidatus Hodarchaeales archaeon]
MKAIIVAGGCSNRLSPLTTDLPKALLRINGKAMIMWIVDAFRSCGIEDINVVRGYRKELLDFPGITYYDNNDYMSNNILSGLFVAEEAMDEGFVFSYSDIIFKTSVVKKLMDSPHDISLIVDTGWAKRYEGRTDHPTDEAELVCVTGGVITRLSKFFNPEAAYGEFIGLAKFTPKAAEILRRNYHRARNNKYCRFEGRFHDATTMDSAYLTDMIQELIERGYPVHSIDIDGGWCEIDTFQDYKYIKANFSKIITD